MSLLRSDEQAKLGELHAVGQGMLLRYQEIVDLGSQHLTSFFEAVLADRTILLEKLAAAEQARGDIPRAADQEINEFRAVGDRILSVVLGEAALQTRISQAEQDWQTMLHESLDLNWSDAEADLIHALLSESRASVKLLSETNTS